MTAPFTLSDLRDWTGATRVGGSGEPELGAVSIDTRTLRPGALFIAISGERHDAHAFLADAVRAGAACLLIERGRDLPDDLATTLPVFCVDDTTRALGALAAGHRARHTGPLVAITGSNGKTTTKEMCASILGVGGPCLKNEGNLNNEFGLPLTLLARETHHQRVVVELGMNHRGEIARLADIARPSVGVITNVGTAHIEFLGSREAIAEEKGDLVAALAREAVAVVNGDDTLLRAQLERSPARRVTFGLSAGVDVRAEEARTEGGDQSFELCADLGRRRVRVAGLGETAIANALAAGAAALATGASLDEVEEGLARYRPVPGRLEPIPLPGGGLVINDTYNANPQSLEVALRILAQLASPNGSGRPRRGIAVLGDMGELGVSTESAHREAGRLAASLGIDALYAVGSYAPLMAEGAQTAGMSPERVFADVDWEAIGARVVSDLRADDRVLVKGSRAMRMERIVKLITQASGSSA